MFKEVFEGYRSINIFILAFMIRTAAISKMHSSNTTVLLVSGLIVELLSITH